MPSTRLVTAFVLALAACEAPTDPDVVDPDDVDTDDVDTDELDTDALPATYDFPSRFGDGSSVSYAGQAFRHLLIEDLKAHVGGLTARLDGGWFPTSGEVTAELDFYLAFDSATSGTVPIGFATTPAPLQATYDDVSTGKKLLDKLAGNDPVGQHEDWTTGLVGWSEPGVTSPEGLVRHWFSELDASAIAWSNGVRAEDPDGAPVTAVYLTADGVDLQQLLQKFLVGAIAFSQGADDYLDDDLDGKGLLSDNTAPESEGAAYTALEHAWDEGFGYFGAPRDQGAWTDAVIASPSVQDSWSPDGAIDLTAEVAWGHATAAAKRDLGSDAGAPTDLTTDAWRAFVAGRALIAGADGALTPAQLDALRASRDEVVRAWDAAIAASVVHYLNEVIVDTAAIGTDGYVFADHAKHWSEMKGFALALPFNPRSALTDDEQAALHDLLRQAPVLADVDIADRAAYVADLLEARALLGSAYGFDPLNLGDDDGTNGW